MNRARSKKGYSEEELLRGIRENDSQVLKQFYTDQYPTVRNFVTQNSGTTNDAQDVFQEALLVAWLNVREKRFTVSNTGGIGAYVHRIAKNKWLDRLRSADYRKMDNLVSEVSDRIVEVSEQESTNERLDYLKSIYDQLDDKCRKVLDMFYFENLSLESIASELDYDIGSIRTIKYRCMSKLRAWHVENLRGLKLKKTR